MARIELGDIAVNVVRKDIKHLHLSVEPPAGRVRIAAPQRMALETIRIYAIAKLGWIKAQRRKMLAQDREPLREYVDRESHYLWGERLLLKVVERDAPVQVTRSHRRLLLQVRPDTSTERREMLLEDWYRGQLKAALPALVAKWEPLLGVRVGGVFVRRMKTRWGSCTPSTASIRLNTELAKKPVECLEYVVVHEMAHLLEPTHGRRFIAQLDRLLPHWVQYRDQLNRLPVRQERWRP